LLAGGTDLLVQAHERNRPITALVSLRRIPELNTVALNGILSLGAMQTVGKVAAHAAIRQDYTALAMGAGLIGSVQIQNMATVGGNICNASPSAIQLLACWPQGRTSSWPAPGASATCPWRLFSRARGRPPCSRVSCSSAWNCPAPRRTAGHFTCAIHPAPAWDLAFAGVAAAVQLSETGEICSARIALGAVAPTPIRALRAEERLAAASLMKP